MSLRKYVGFVLSAVFSIVVTVVPVANADQTSSGPTFAVMNTSETPPDGVWFRNSPHTSDTDRVTGHGVYSGEQVQLRCFSWGDAVGVYNDTLWYDVVNVNRPTNNGVENSGFLNAHYINDGLPANQIDAGVPDCSAAAATPSVTLAQGPAAPAGYRYAVTLDHFAANSSVSVTCYDSVSPGGFFTFSLTTDGSGHAFTQDYCYSGDGPDHWIVAGGVSSNTINWAGSTGGGGGGGTPTPTPTPTGPQCDPVLLTLVGSGQAAKSGMTEMSTLASTVKADAKTAGANAVWVPVYYPAVAWYKFLGASYITGNIAQINLGGLQSSEDSGVAALRAALNTVKTNCPARRIMISGYSQGADVVSRVVLGMSTDAQSTISIGLMGNPSFLPGYQHDYGSYNKQRRGIRPSTGAATYTLATLANRTIDACLVNDPICNFNVSNLATLISGNNAHYNYVGAGYATLVGHRLWQFSRS